MVRSFGRAVVGQGGHEGRPRKREFFGDAEAVLGHAGRSADATQDALAAAGADRAGNGPRAAESGVLGAGAELARGEQHRVAPFADERRSALN